MSHRARPVPATTRTAARRGGWPVATGPAAWSRSTTAGFRPPRRRCQRTEARRRSRSAAPTHRCARRPPGRRGGRITLRRRGGRCPTARPCRPGSVRRGRSRRRGPPRMDRVRPQAPVSPLGRCRSQRRCPQAVHAVALDAARWRGKRGWGTALGDWCSAVGRSVRRED
jgi:hypothetical protein